MSSIKNKPIEAQTAIAAVAALLDASSSTLARLKESLGLPIDISGLETKTDANSKYTDISTQVSSVAAKITVVEENVADMSAEVTANTRNIGTFQGQISANAGAIAELKTDKQDKLTAGKNITIAPDNTISASGGGVVVRNWQDDNNE